MSDFIPRKAQKQVVKLKMAIQGPSGSGKTEGALSLASNFAPDAKILLIDTENESASLYADRYNFDTISLTAPYTSERYQKAMQVAVTGGYDVLIVDSITQQWDGEGGILRRKEEKDRSGGNSFTNWASFTPEHTRFMEFIKQLPVHTIVTMRSKQAYVLEKNDRGKETPRKVGLDPIQREGMEYEYTIVFEVNMAHRATTSKNRTTLFQGEDLIDLTSPKVAADIREWLANGVLLPRPPGDVAGAVVDEVERQKAAPASVPPELDWEYNPSSGVMMSRIVTVAQRKTKKGSDYLTIGLSGTIEGSSIATYFHASHQDELLAAKGKVCKFGGVTVDGKFVNIAEVLEIDGQTVAKPEPEADPEVKARLLASTLEMTEGDLKALLTMSGGEWAEVLSRIEQFAAEREVTA